jgi:hypothetical protein
MICAFVKCCFMYGTKGEDEFCKLLSSIYKRVQLVLTFERFYRGEACSVPDHSLEGCASATKFYCLSQIMFIMSR